MKKTFLFILLAAFAALAFKNDKPAYAIFNKDGKPVKYSKMMKDLETADMVFYGEMHTDPISHWLEYNITRDLYKIKKDSLVLGAEMFEADNQLIMNEYLAGDYGAKKFEAEIKLWKNYKTDYKPLVEFAKKHNLPFIATDIHRRYASMVYKKGFDVLDSLSAEAKKYIGPDLVKLYDPEIKCYKDMMNMKDMKDHVDENFPKAQAAKDATMAYFILKNWSPGKLFLHYNGSYHSDNFQGIVWWINKLHPGLNIKTISTVNQEDISRLDEENLNLADYIVVVPDDMTNTSR
ncbi:MAG: ChaN family lipoprotein [Chlorobi bacterium]|nr:ChaN family lipoprotein [Chlorobiota bacterium]